MPGAARVATSATSVVVSSPATAAEAPDSGAPATLAALSSPAICSVSKRLSTLAGGALGSRSAISSQSTAATAFSTTGASISPGASNRTATAPPTGCQAGILPISCRSRESTGSAAATRHNKGCRRAADNKGAAAATGATAIASRRLKSWLFTHDDR